MWNAKIVDKNSKNGVLLITVEFTDGTSLFGEVFDLTGGSLQVLQQKVQTRLATLNATAQLATDVVLNTTIQIEPPTKVSADKQTFQDKYQKLLSLTKAVETGVLAKDNPELLTLQLEVSTSFDSAFL